MASDIKKLTVVIGSPDEASRSQIASSADLQAADAEMTRTFVGREAWLLDRLLRAGPRGITTLETPAPRISHYLMKVRRAGIVVETVREPHAGSYSGSHGRFILRSSIRVLSEERA